MSSIITDVPYPSSLCDSVQDPLYGNFDVDVSQDSIDCIPYVLKVKCVPLFV